jgi:cell division protein FtsB
MEPNPWPPSNAKLFVRSDAFGRLVLEVVDGLARRYPHMDFTDAAAQLFAWFDAKVSKNRRFINSRRFPTLSSFKAYLRQSAFNAGRLAARQRQQQAQIESLPPDEPIAVQRLSSEQRAMLQDQADKLPEPHKSVFERKFFDEDDCSMIASILGRTEKEVHKLYEEAVDLLVDCWRS